MPILTVKTSVGTPLKLRRTGEDIKKLTQMTEELVNNSAINGRTPKNPVKFGNKIKRLLGQGTRG